MAQYYQIVGQGQSLTLEDLQRYCPNLICSDGIIVNQDDQQYPQQQVVVQQAEQPSDIIVSDGVQPQLVVGDGLQYQQQYIIRHEPPTQQPRPDFQQQQQQHQQQQQQQALHRHQVYYTSDLPMDAQVALQQAHQIIDASQRPQHLVSPAHVLSQPTVIHPAQQPPPQPPPSPAQHGPPPTPPQQQQQQQQQQQMSRASPQLMQHLQHQQQIHLQQLQQQQLQHQIQQQQHQHLQSQQIQPQQIQHQIVMHTAYVNQAGTPTRPAPPRLLNQALNNQSGVTLVRTPRQVRPRRPAMRSPMPTPPLQAAPRLLNPQIPQSPQTPTGGRGMATNGAGAVRPRAARPGSPRVLNPHAAHAQHRPPRSRTPLLQQNQQQPPQQQQQQQPQQHMPPQQQHPQHALAQHVLNHPQQIQQLNQLKLTNQQQQILINQQSQSPGQQPARIITPQGTIVTQTMQTTMTQHHTVQTNQNGPLPQQNLNSTPQRASPHPQQVQQQVKKVTVQPNNANDMDDLEESIKAVIVQKNPITDNQNTPQQFQSPPNLRQNHTGLPPGQNMNQPHQINFNPQHGFQQQLSFDHTHLQQPQTISQLLMEPENPDEERQFISLPNGQRMSIAEYRRIQSSRVLSQQQQHQQQQQQQQQQQSRDSGRQTLVRSKEQQRPVQRVHPMQAQQQSNHLLENNEALSGPSEQTPEPQSAKMLIFLQNGEQRLITFTLPKESCTLQEVLEQVNVPFTDDTNIQCMQNTNSEIDYFVSVGSTTRIEDMLENHPMLVREINNRNSPSVLPQAPNSEISTPEKGPCPENANNSPSSPEQRSPPPRYVEGMLAVCKFCGYTGYDFSRCERCKRVFTEAPKSVLASKKVEQKKKEPEKNLLDKQISPDTIKLNLLKTTVKTLNNKNAVQDKKPTRVRKPRGKQPDPEPVILTLSSDEEDSNSSIFNNHQEQLANTKEPSLSEIEGSSSDGMDNDTPDGPLN